MRVIDERDKLLIMATDGVWDVMDNDEAMAIATSGGPQAGADKIVEMCRSRWDKQMAGRCARDAAEIGPRRARAEIGPRWARERAPQHRRDRAPCVRSRDDITCIVMDFTHADVQ